MLAGLAAGDPAGSSQGAFQQPASPVAREISSLFWIITIIAILVAAVVYSLLAITIVRFRADRVPADDGESKEHASSAGADAKRPLPPHYHNKALEGGITGFTAVAFALLVVFSWGTLNAIETPSEPVDLYVDVVASQWSWKFEYPAQGVVESQTLSEMHVPTGAVVRLNVTATDVAHAIWIPDLGVKIDAYPGRVNHFWFKSEREGRFLLQCAEFCGGAHSNMHAVVVSEPRASFDAWVAQKQQGPAPAPIADGQAVNITLSDWAVTPAVPLNIDLGANVTFRINNAGAVDHAFALDAPYNWSSALVPAGGTLTVSVLFATAVENGTAYCPVAGHRAAGMAVALRVAPAGRTIDLYLYDPGSTTGPRTWAIEPTRVEVTPGELVKFRVHNEGTMAHNVKVGDPYVGVISPTIDAGQVTQTPAFTVTQSTAFWCDIVGHRQLGMEGTLDAGGEVKGAKESVPGFEALALAPALAVAALASGAWRGRRR